MQDNKKTPKKNAAKKQIQLQYIPFTGNNVYYLFHRPSSIKKLIYLIKKKPTIIHMSSTIKYKKFVVPNPNFFKIILHCFSPQNKKIGAGHFQGGGRGGESRKKFVKLEEI